MPLIVMVGLPCSGKSYWSNKLLDYFNQINNQTLLLSDNDLVHDVNQTYSDSRREKELRGQLKSSVQRLLNKERIIILDALNYIKGYRYELFCIAKEQATTYCVIECSIKREEAWRINQDRSDGKRYNEKIFDELYHRYESPDSRNRWDSPYFLLSQEVEASFEDIRRAIVDKIPLKPNQATQSQPLSEASFLYQLDSQTKEVIDHIARAQKSGPIFEIKIPGEKNKVQLKRSLAVPEMNRLRRSFITYTKMHPIEKVNEIKSTFIEYLNSTGD